MSRLRGILLVLALLLATTEARAAGISISVNGFSFQPQQTVTVSFFAVGFGQATAPSIRSYVITLNFDSALLAVQSLSFGDPGLGNQLDPQGFGTLQAPVSGTGFRAIGTGFGILNGIVSGIADANGEPFTGLSNSLAISFQVVPEPGTAWLIGAGCLLLGARRRGRSRADRVASNARGV